MSKVLGVMCLLVICSLCFILSVSVENIADKWLVFWTGITFGASVMGIVNIVLPYNKYM